MNLIQKHMTVSAFILIAVLMSIIAYQAGGQSSSGAASQPARTATVVTVNLNAVLEGLAQRSDAESKMRAMGQRMIDERERRQAHVESLRDQLVELNKARQPSAPPTEAEMELGAKLEWEMLSFQAWAQGATERLDIEQALLLQDLYRAIRIAAEDMAKANGYDLVLTDDSRGELTNDPTSNLSNQDQVRQQIAARKILYAGPRIDITNDLIARMNNQYRAGR